MTTIQRVTVAGSGVLGSQIAYQAAYRHKDVTVYDISEAAIEQAQQRIESLRARYLHDLHIDDAAFDDGLTRIHYATNLGQAVAQADLVIEAITEKPAIKHTFYQELAQVAPAQTIFASNSSTLVPSMFMADTGRPEKFLNLHFANQVWLNNTAEIMGSPQTAPAVFDEVVAFAGEIGMIPIPLKKEQPGYILNSLLIPFLNAGLALWTNGVAEPQVIDKTWMKATGAPMGPFAILDMIGMRMPYHIILSKASRENNAVMLAAADKLKAMMDAGKLGAESGEGFYTYPNPAFQQASFLQAESADQVLAPE